MNERWTRNKRPHWMVRNLRCNDVFDPLCKSHAQNVHGSPGYTI